MATITTRSTKGSPLTHTEMDDNFSNINAATLPTGGSNNQVLAKTSATDYATGWVTLTDTNTTYAISAETATSGANLRLTGSDSSTDNVNIVGGAGVTITRTDANTITIDAAGTDPVAETLRTLVYNADSVTLTKGTPVYVFGAQGQNISVKRANNTDDATSAQTLGLVESSIAAGAEGYVVTFGEIENMDTAAYTEGAAFYVGATAGSITFTKPYAPNHLVYLGFVEKANASSGRVFVKVQNGYELDEIHNVNINHNTAIAGNQYLKYNSSNSLWENAGLDISHDTTPLLGGNLVVNGQSIVSTSNGDIAIIPDGTGKINLTDFVSVGNSAVTIGNTMATYIYGDLTISPGSMTVNQQALFNNFGVSGIPATYLQGVNEATVYVSALNASGIPKSEIALYPSANTTITGYTDIHLNTGAGNKVYIGNGANTAVVTSNGGTNLLLQTNNGTNSGSIQLGAGVSGNVAITHGAFGKVTLGNWTFGNTAILSSSGTQPLTLASDNSNIVIRGSGGSGDVDINATNNINLTPASFTNNIQGLFNNFGVSGIPAAYLQAANETVIYVSAYNSSGIPGAEIMLDPTSSGSVTLGGANSGSIVLQNGSSGNVVLTSGFGANYVKLNPQFGKVMVGNGSNTAVVTTNGATSLTLQTNDGTNSGSITLGSGLAGDITLTHGLSGKVTVGNYFFSNTAIVSSSGSQALTLQTAAGNTTSIVMNSGPTGNLAITTPLAGSVTIGNQFFANTAIISSSGTQPLTMKSNNSNIVIQGSGSAGNINIQPTGNTNINNGVVGYKVYAIGNSGTATLTPDATNGQVQTITATGNFTLSAFNNPVSGQQITFIITQDATGSRTLTSTMKFEGASKTLSTAANAIDILDVWYVGTTYYASLTKGYA